MELLTTFAQATVAVSYGVLCVFFVLSALRTVSYTKRIVRGWTALVTGGWAIYYAVRLWVHPPVHASRTLHGLLIGLFAYQLWTATVRERGTRG